MDAQDVEFIQILNIIKRGQRLVIQAKTSGVDTTKAEELINEAKYALKIGNRDMAIEYAKKCMIDVIQSKRELDKETLSKEGALENLTKEELRRKCTDMGLDPLGLKEDLIARIKDKLIKDREEREALEVQERREQEVREAKAREAPGTKLPRSGDGSAEPPVKLKAPAEQPTREVSTIPDAEELSEVVVKISDQVRSAPVGKPQEFNAERDASRMITGLSYLVEEQRADRIYQLYSVLKRPEKIGFAISRTNPRLIERAYSLDVKDFVWLTDREVGKEIRSVPPSLESIIYFIEEFIDNNPEGVILLDGLEYLIGNNTFNPVIRFIRRLVDKISTTQCILLVSLAPETLDSSQVTLLEKDLYPLNYL